MLISMYGCVRYDTSFTFENDKLSTTKTKQDKTNNNNKKTGKFGDEKLV